MPKVLTARMTDDKIANANQCNERKTDSTDQIEQ
jgi:hypothetical protein